MRPREHPVLALALLTLLWLPACAQPTYYEAQTDGEGYADQEIADGRYRVTFAGNSITPRETVENYLLYRAAEITLASGHDYFILADYDVVRDVTYRRYVSLPPGGFSYGGYYGHYRYWDRYGYGPYYDPFAAGYAEITARQTDKYRAFATIAVYSGTPPADDPDAYAARDVIERLGPTIVRPGAAPGG